MVQINFAKREVSCKVVFYGPARSGKTANLRSIHKRTPENIRGALTTIATDTNRTLFFDFLPLNLGLVAEIGTKINLYAVPYIANQNATRLLVLEGIDGIVFVADSSPDKMADNVEALENLRSNLAELGRDLADVPIVFQWNKSDATDRLTDEQLNAELNPDGHPAFDACADTGVGVFTCLKGITQRVLVTVSEKMAGPGQKAQSEPAPVVRPEPAPVVRPEPAPVARPEPAPVALPEPAPVFSAETDPEPVFDEVLELPQARSPVEVTPTAKPDAESDIAESDIARAEYEQAFGQPERPAAPTFEPPSAVMEAAESLAQPGNYTRPPRSSKNEEEPAALGHHLAPSQADEEDGSRMVSVGGQRPPTHASSKTRPGRAIPGWETESGPSRDTDSFHQRRTHPAVDRRRTPRPADTSNVVPTANLVAGALCALVSLIAIGYMVFALL